MSQARNEGSTRQAAVDRAMRPACSFQKGEAFTTCWRRVPFQEHTSHQHVPSQAVAWCELLLPVCLCERTSAPFPHRLGSCSRPQAWRLPPVSRCSEGPGQTHHCWVLLPGMCLGVSTVLWGHCHSASANNNNNDISECPHGAGTVLGGLLIVSR